MKTILRVGVNSGSLLRKLLFSGCVIAGGSAFAQSAPDTAAGIPLTPSQQRLKSMVESTHVITMGEESSSRDSIEKMLNRFYVDQFRHSQDPRAPYFMFLSKNGNLAMGVGGLIRMRGYFDWNGSIPISGFSPYMITIPKDPTQLRNLAATPAGTGLFFTLLGKNPLLGDFRGFIQGDFSGYNNRGFKLKKAYVQFKDWTVGYATTTFEDTKAKPATIDAAGANGVNSKTNVLVRYAHTFKGDHWSVAGSFEFPSSSKNADGEYTKACNDYVPDLAAFAQYQWAQGESHVRLSGLMRTLSYRDMVQAKNHNIIGWGAQLSTVIKILPQFDVMGIASVGQGHASYTTDLGIGKFDLIGDPHQKGKLYAPTAVGYVFSATYYFKPNFFANLALSEQRYYPKEHLNDDQYKYGLYGAVNLYWDITPRFEVGMEYLAGKRMNFNGSHGNANRITAMAMFSF